MPHILTVSEVRQAIYHGAGGCEASGSGTPSTALLGQLFHETFGRLTGPDPTVNFVGPLERADRSVASWESQLLEHTYLWCVGPQVVAHQAQLQRVASELLTYWRAVQHLTKWLCAVLWQHSQPAQAIEEMRRFIFEGSEVECQVELQDPAWTDTVVLHGRIDALLRQPTSGQVCAVELKLGQTNPEADLAQGCLYHLLLTESTRIAGGSPARRLALLTFQPEPHERVWTADQLKDAQQQLRALVGHLAGVVRGKPEKPRPRPKGLREMAERLETVFKEFDAPIQLEGEPLVGSSFYRFWATPARKVSARKILGMAETVWPRLRTEQPPHISLEHGRLAIDVQRPDRQIVPWHAIPPPKPRERSGGCSQFPVGVSIHGHWTFADFANPEHAHILVAGTTGSGKSVWLRALIASLCHNNTADSLRLLLIDPKRTGFGMLAGSPFLYRPIVYPSEEDILVTLDELIQQMEGRYARFEQTGSSDLPEYLTRQRAPIPRIVCICDEYADLILADTRIGKEVERRIGRIGAKGRAAGLHLVLATQRPSRDVVGGVIKANLNARVALKVNSALESRLILEQNGAETLLGYGDLLFKDLGQPSRLQAPLISDQELKRATQVP